MVPPCIYHPSVSNPHPSGGHIFFGPTGGVGQELWGGTTPPLLRIEVPFRIAPPPDSVPKDLDFGPPYRCLVIQSIPSIVHSSKGGCRIVANRPSFPSPQDRAPPCVQVQRFVGTKQVTMTHGRLARSVGASGGRASGGRGGEGSAPLFPRVFNAYFAGVSEVFGGKRLLSLISAVSAFFVFLWTTTPHPCPLL